MTLAEWFEERGRTKGRKQGREEGKENVRRRVNSSCDLRNGVDSALVSKTTGLSEQEPTRRRTSELPTGAGSLRTRRQVLQSAEAAFGPAD